VISVQGVNTHPSIGKGKMVNAIRILSDFIAALPQDRLSPETTDGRDGFLHPYAFDGSVARSEARIILRDFDTPKLDEYANLLRGVADQMRSKHPTASIDVSIRKQYRNMKDGLAVEPRAVAYAVEATRNAGFDPVQSVIRGGTDGSLLTAMGLPTPNLSTGEHNPHSPLEWTSLEEMSNALAVLVELAKSWSREE
jgi:tripeptide aminopeptidase